MPYPSGFKLGRCGFNVGNNEFFTVDSFFRNEFGSKVKSVKKPQVLEAGIAVSQAISETKIVRQFLYHSVDLPRSDSR